MNGVPAILGPAARHWHIASRDIVLSALAATLAWWASWWLFGDARPVFASIAAIVCLAPGIASHGRQAVALVVGVAVGIVVGECARRLHWPPALLIGAVTAVAMFAAAGIGLDAVMVIQAGASAVLVVGGASVAGPARIGDSLVGGGIGLLFSQVLFTPDPLARLRQAGDALVRTVDAALAGDGHDPAQAIGAVRDADLALGNALTFAAGTTRWTVRGRLRSSRILDAVDAWRRPLGRLAALAILADGNDAMRGALRVELDHARALLGRRPTVADGAEPADAP